MPLKETKPKATFIKIFIGFLSSYSIFNSREHTECTGVRIYVLDLIFDV